MPTYLLAWVLFEHDYDFVGDADEKYFVWTRPDAVEESHYALRESKRVIRKMEEYTGIKYPLPKLDLIALPRLPGAMENWGIVTYG